jgi:hypothetical protein
MLARVKRGRAVLVGATVAVTALLASTALASAAPTPPFTECPAVGQDTSCETLIVIQSDGSLKAYNDPSQGPFDGIEDTLVGVLNESSSTVSSVKISGPDVFGFDGDGICSGYTPGPPDCPYGTTGYEGPKTEFEVITEDEGSVLFTEGALAPGESTYFSLEENVNLRCETECQTLESTSLSTLLEAEGGPGEEEVSVEPGEGVKDTAELSGNNSPKATGTVSYAIYKDAECKGPSESAGTVTVSEGKVPPSESKALTEPGTYYWQALYSGDEENASSKSTCGSEREVVGKTEEALATSLSTTLAGEGQSGPGITVNEGAGVTDDATIEGTNSSKATGTVNYKVYSDSECTQEVDDAGTVSVTSGSVPPSDAETLAPGTYYWQASYSGDGANIGSKSACGSEVETVIAVPKCAKAIGLATFKAAGGKTTISNKLYTELTKKQKLVLKWENGENTLKLTKLISATCTVTAKQSVFSGEGPATVNGEGGYKVKFKLVLTTKSHRFAVHAKITKPEEETLRVNASAKSVSSEEVS